MQGRVDSRDQTPARYGGNPSSSRGQGGTRPGDRVGKDKSTEVNTAPACAVTASI